MCLLEHVCICFPLVTVSPSKVSVTRISKVITHQGLLHSKHLFPASILTRWLWSLCNSGAVQ